MPELPEVETIARALNQEAAGRTILSVEVIDPTALQPSPEAFQALVLGRRIASVGRRGKLLLLHLDDGGADAGLIAVHLRMTGRVFVLAPDQEAIRPRAVLQLSAHGDEKGPRLAFSDVRRFGSMHAFTPGAIASWPFYQTLGPEPLTMTAADFRERTAPSGKANRARIKALLLDQTVLAGVGNIYADEALFRAGIRPDTPAGLIAPAQLDALFAAIQAVLTQAIAENGSSIRDYRDAHGDAGSFQNHFQAYKRGGKPCLTCGATMQAMRVAGRTSTFCPRCQPAPAPRR